MHTHPLPLAILRLWTTRLDHETARTWVSGVVTTTIVINAMTTMTGMMGMMGAEGAMTIRLPPDVACFRAAPGLLTEMMIARADHAKTDDARIATPAAAMMMEDSAAWNLDL